MTVNNRNPYSLILSFSTPIFNFLYNVKVLYNGFSGASSNELGLQTHRITESLGWETFKIIKYNLLPKISTKP